jgi:hypothetical protein
MIVWAQCFLVESPGVTVVPSRYGDVERCPRRTVCAIVAREWVDSSDWAVVSERAPVAVTD